MKLVRDGKEIEAEIRICLLYDPDSGNVIHTHQNVRFPGAAAVTHDHIEARARTLAARRGRDVSRLKALHVSSEEWNETRAYRVDVQSGQLVEISDLPLRHLGPH